MPTHSNPTGSERRRKPDSRTMRIAAALLVLIIVAPAHGETVSASPDRGPEVPINGKRFIDGLGYFPASLRFTSPSAAGGSQERRGTGAVKSRASE